MARVRVKICGITCAQDALAAAEAGADAIGLVFHPASRRCVSDAMAREILAALPPMVCPVGLFVDAPAEQIIGTAKALHLRHIQLNGEESPELVAELDGFIVLKAVRVTPNLASELRVWREAMGQKKIPNLRGLVLETAGQVGGSGVGNDWDAAVAAKEAGAFDALPPLTAAGGLRPENVAEVVRRLRPWAMDVSSGVEVSPGRKSAEKIRRFIEAVQSVLPLPT